MFSTSKGLDNFSAGSGGMSIAFTEKQVDRVDIGAELAQESSSGYMIANQYHTTVTA